MLSGGLQLRKQRKASPDPLLPPLLEHRALPSVLPALDFRATDVRMITVVLSSIPMSPLRLSLRFETRCCPISGPIHLLSSHSNAFAGCWFLEDPHSCKAAKLSLSLRRMERLLLGAGQKRPIKAQDLFRVYWCVEKCLAASLSMIAVYVLIFFF